MDILKESDLFLKEASRPLIVVLGPTASGKTDLSLKIAKKFKGEIISADSRQIYKYMPIATDVLPQDLRQGVPHHLLEFIEPDKMLSMAEFKDLALAKIAEIYKRGHLPVLVGGTGLYISAIIDGYEVPRIAPDPKLRDELQNEDSGELYKKLQKLDPKTAKKIHPHNTRYVIRALEINLLGKKRKIDKKKKPSFDVLKTGIAWPRDVLYERINRRVDNQFARGLVDEVRALLAKGYNPALPSMYSLGVKEIIPYLKKEKSLEECAELLKKNTRNYAKRQITWFGRYDDVKWLRGEE